VISTDQARRDRRRALGPPRGGRRGLCDAQRVLRPGGPTSRRQLHDQPGDQLEAGRPALAADEVLYCAGLQIARAARRIPAEFRTALSGTPLENRLTELWSVVDLILPGYLGSEREFRVTYRNPSQQQLQRLLACEQLFQRLVLIHVDLTRRLRPDRVTSMRRGDPPRGDPSSCHF